MGIYILAGVIGAMWAAAVASSKNNDVVVWGLFGLLFPLFGVIGAYAAEPTKRPRLDLAMREVQPK